MTKLLKYAILSVCLLSTCGNIFALTESNEVRKCDSVMSYSDSVVSHIASIIEDMDMRKYRSESTNRYKLYPTENMYNFLKLDTKTGKIEQVQWSLDRDKEGSVSINRDDLSRNSVIGTFELYPTPNMYQFVLLDKYSGRTWHVQWGMENKKRWIRQIY